MKGMNYRRTTASQRKRLFEVWKKSQDVAKACAKAGVSERTFYYWKPRFMAGGYEALEQFADHSPKKPIRTKAKVEQQVIQMKQAEPSWGKRRISEELAKKNNWVALVSPNTVRRILQEAGLWPEPQTTAKKRDLKP